MNTQAIGRIAWKEFRFQLPIWSVFLTFALCGIVWMIFDQPPTFVSLTFETIAILATVYGLAAAAISFSSEKEHGTDRFLATLPLRKRELVIGKVSLVAAATIVFVLVVVATALLTRQLFGSGGPSSLAAKHWFLNFIALPTLECLAWGFLFSFVCRRSIVAAALAIICAMTSLSLMIGIFASGFRTFDPQAMSLIIPHRMVLLTVLLVANGWLASRWFDTETIRRFDNLTQLGNTSDVSKRFRRATVNMTLQTVRTNWIWMLIIPSATILIWVYIFATANSHHGIANVTIGVSFIPSAIAGFMVFRSDQNRQQYRFLVQQGEYPTQFWLARVLFWLPVVVVFPLVSLLLLWTRDASSVMHLLGLEFYQPSYSLQNPVLAETIFRMLTISFWVFAVGQFCSIYFRSWPIAFAATILVCGISSSFWVFVFEIDLPLWWTIWPLILCLFAGSWLRVPRWFAEEDSLAAYCKPLVPLLATFAIVCCLVPVHRYYLTGGSTELAVEFVNFKSKANRNNQLLGDLRSSQQPNYQQSIATLTAKGSYRTWSRWDVDNLMTKEAQKYYDRGELGTSFDQIMLRHKLHCNLDIIEKAGFDYRMVTSWTKHPKQTPETIKYAIGEFQKEIKKIPDLHEQLKLTFLYLAKSYKSWKASNKFNIQIPFHWLSGTPWERQVYFKSAQVVLENMRPILNRFSASLAEGDPMEDHVRDAELGMNINRVARRAGVRDTDRLFQTIMIDELNATATRRVRLLQLALAGWMLEHGHYPDSLEQLCPDYLEKLPLDPWTATNFVYRPKGTTHDLFILRGSALNEYQLDAETPFVISFGENSVRFLDRKLDRTVDLFPADQEFEDLISVVAVDDYLVAGNLTLIELPPPNRFDIVRTIEKDTQTPEDNEQ